MSNYDRWLDAEKERQDADDAKEEAMYSLKVAAVLEAQPDLLLTLAYRLQDYNEALSEEEVIAIMRQDIIVDRDDVVRRCAEYLMKHPH